MKKSISIMLIVILVLGMTTISFAKSKESKTLTPEEIIELYDVMLEAASNTVIEKAGVTTIYVEHNGLTGTVTIEEEAQYPNEFEIMPSSIYYFYNIPDGSRVITTTLNAASGLGGDLILKSYYTMKNNGTAIDVTDTDAILIPPIGYTNGGTSSYIVSDQSKYFKTSGIYTIVHLKFLRSCFTRLKKDSLAYWKER